jgi:hypothetical protein
MKVKTKKNIHEHVLDDKSNQNLKVDTTYDVIGLTQDHLRIINEKGEPILYPNYLFDTIDSTIPEKWVRQDFDDGEYHTNPPELSEKGFYEKYFDGDSNAITIFKKIFD